MSIPDMPPVPARDSGAPGPERARRGRFGRLGRWLAWLSVVVLVLVMAALAATVLALRTEAGTRQLWSLATRLSAGTLSGKLEGGTVAHGLRLRDVVFASGETRVTVDRLEGNWSFHWSPARLHVEWLRIGAVTLRLPAAQPERAPATLPKSLELPLAVDVDALTLQRLAWLQGPPAMPSEMVFADLAGSLHSDGQRHRVSVERLVTPYGKLAANAQIAVHAPFALNGAALLEGNWQKESFSLSANLRGSLAAVRAEVEASGDRMHGRAEADLTLFGKVPFTHVRVNGEHINPRLFSPSAPQANLSVQAELRPMAGAAAAASAPVATASAAPASAAAAKPASAADNTPLRVAGDVHIVNHEAGKLDAGRLPVESAQAHIEVSEAAQSVRDLRVALAGGGTISGGGALREGRGGFDLDVRNLDPQALYGSLRRMRLSGPVILRLEPGRQSAALDLAGGEFKLFADVRLDAEALTLTALRAGIGAGTLNAEGKLSLKDEQPFSFKGKLANFDPASVAAVAPGSINADFATSGTLAPQRRVALDFAVRDSVYAGLPMRGEGKLRLAGERLLPSQATIDMAGNQAQLNGSFGARGDRLQLHVDAPQLERLKFGVAGVLKLDADITGTLARPEIVGTYHAQSLVVGPHHVASASGSAELRGGLDGTLTLQLNARDYRGPVATLRTLDVTLSGTQAKHSFELKAAGALRDRPMQLTLAGQGAWQGQAGWNGTIRTLEERGTVNVRLIAPAQLLVADQRVRLGAAGLQFEQARVNVDAFEFDHGRIRTQGNLDSLQVANVLRLAEALTGEAPPVRSDLVLDGRWNITLAETASGFAELRRRSGDVSVSAGRGYTTLGLGETALRAEFAGSRLNLRGGIEASRIGKVVVDASAGLIQEQGLMTVTPASTLTGKVSLEVPKIKALEAFSGPQYAFDGTLAADLQLAGTVGNPLLTGKIDGSGIALTLYDLGIRLTDGIVHVVLDQNTIELKQVEFRGGDGRIVATGNVKLGETSPNLSGKIVADKLQLFASPERTLIVSGDASIVNENRQIVIRGKFRVDRGLFDLPKAGAPELGDDVVVVRRRDQREIKTAATPLPEDKPASRFSPLIDLTLDLGDSFRFRGAGADLRLGGELGLRSAPLTPLRATGTIRVTDGTYEAFGRKLNIERGIVNFNGPVDNPNLNIRAMRRNQDVEAGVEVTGTVRLPRVKLVSEPNVPDEDKLSWLMFGYGAEGAAAGQQRQLGVGTVGGAALGILGGRAGKGIVQHLGIDEFSIGPSTSGLNDQQVVSVGKNVTERISVGYEQSLTSASNVVKMTWAFSRRWSLIAKGGSINGLSVLFNRRFSSWGNLFSGASSRAGTERSQTDASQVSDSSAKGNAPEAASDAAAPARP